MREQNRLNNKVMPRHLHFKGALQRANFSYLMPLIYYSLRSHLMPQSLLFTDLWGNPIYSKWLWVHEVIAASKLWTQWNCCMHKVIIMCLQGSALSEHVGHCDLAFDFSKGLANFHQCAIGLRGSIAHVKSLQQNVALKESRRLTDIRIRQYWIQESLRILKKKNVDIIIHSFKEAWKKTK